MSNPGALVWANPLLLQKQLRENAANLQDFAKDLKSWGEEMTRKESGIKEVKEVMENLDFDFLLTFHYSGFSKKKN